MHSCSKKHLIFVSVSYMIHLLYKFVQQSEKDEDDSEGDNASEDNDKSGYDYYDDNDDNRELKQPRRRRQQKPHKFAYLTTKNSIFARFARAFLIF